MVEIAPSGYQAQAPGESESVEGRLNRYLRLVVAKAQDKEDCQDAAYLLIDGYLNTMEKVRSCPADLTETPLTEIILPEDLLLFQMAANLVFATDEQISNRKETVDGRPDEEIIITTQAVGLAIQRKRQLDQLGQIHQELLTTEGQLGQARKVLTERFKNLRADYRVINPYIYTLESRGLASE